MIKCRHIIVLADVITSEHFPHSSYQTMYFIPWCMLPPNKPQVYLVSGRTSLQKGLTCTQVFVVSKAFAISNPSLLSYA